MANNQQQTLNLYDTSIFLKKRVGVDNSNSVREDFHLERGSDNNVKVVSDGKTDYQKMIDSEAKNAGLVNILKFQEMRYGSVKNAIIANEEKKFYGDVSNIDDNIGAQSDLVAKTNAEIEKLCKELGLTKEQLLDLTPEKYVEIKQAQAAQAAAQAAQAAAQAAQAAAQAEGGAE